MIKHIVMFKSQGKNKESVINKLKEDLDALPNKIKEIKYYETGLNISDSKNAFDLVLISEFESDETLESYRLHPDHQLIINSILENKIETKVVDFEY